MTCREEQTIITFAFMLTIFLILLLSIYALVRTGIHPCVNGISGTCTMVDMDNICLINRFNMPICHKYCRRLFATNKEEVCNSEFCNNPETNTAIGNYCLSKNIINYKSGNNFKRTRINR